MQSLRLLGRQASASAPRRFTAFAYGGARPMSSASAAVPEEPEEPPAKEEATVAAPEPTKGAAHVLNSRLKPKEVRTPCAVRRAPALRPRCARAAPEPRRRHVDAARRCGPRLRIHTLSMAFPYMSCEVFGLPGLLRGTHT